jgi:hypothetical protein
MRRGSAVTSVFYGGLLTFGFALSLVTQAAVASDGTLFATTMTPSGPTVVKVDPATGGLTTVLSIPGFMAAGGSALDAVHHVYFLLANEGGPMPPPGALHLFGIDTETGTVRTNATLSMGLGALQTDGGSVFGTTNAGFVPTLVRVDPATGTMADVATFPGFMGLRGFSALDPTSHLYFFLTSDAGSFPMPGSLHLLGVDTETGTIRTNAVLGPDLVSLEFDGGSVFGTVITPSGPGLVKVDPATGAVATVATFPGFMGLRQGVSALDPANHIYFFPTGEAGPTPIPGPLHLLGVDTLTGTLETNVVLSGPDLFGFEFEPPTAAPLTVDIDIKPDDSRNRINPRSHGTIPVAILSTPSFDAIALVDRSTLRFGRTGSEQSLAFCNTSADDRRRDDEEEGDDDAGDSGEDVNGDGLRDLVCHFFTQATDFRFGDTRGVLTGKTISGTSFIGSDAVRVVGKEDQDDRRN